MSVVPSLFPYFSYHGSRSSEVSEVTSRTLKYLFLVLTPPTAVFVFFAKDIMHLWLGAQFAENSTLVLQLTTLIFFFNAFAFVPFTSVQALGRPDLKAILDLVAIPIYSAAAWWLIKNHGINGAAFAKLLITILDCAVLYVFASKLKAFSLRDCISGPLLRAIIVSGALLALVFAIESMHLKLLLAVPLILLSFVGYVLMFWAFAVDDEDRGTIAIVRTRVSGILTGRRATPPLPITGNNTVL
jgi:O-antigen/teichoic acid export membrane protein